MARKLVVCIVLKISALQAFVRCTYFISCHPLKNMLRKLLTPNMQRIKSICATGVVLEQ